MFVKNSLFNFASYKILAACDFPSTSWNKRILFVSEGSKKLLLFCLGSRPVSVDNTENNEPFERTISHASFISL